MFKIAWWHQAHFGDVYHSEKVGIYSGDCLLSARHNLMLLRIFGLRKIAQHKHDGNHNLK